MDPGRPGLFSAGRACGNDSGQCAFQYGQVFKDAISKLKGEGRYRVFADIVRRRGAYPEADLIAAGAPTGAIAVWCSNDYLCMGQHPEVLAAMHEAHRRDRRGLRGHPQHFRHRALLMSNWKRELADLHGKEAGLIFTSGFVSNDATLSTLAKLLPGLIFFSDALNHASMIEGIRRSGAEKRIFRHNDMAHLEELLQAADPAAPKIIAFEGVYSMEGDFAPDRRASAISPKNTAR